MNAPLRRAHLARLRRINDAATGFTEMLPTGWDGLGAEVTGSLATITLARPKVNALSQARQRALGRTAGLIAERDDVAAVIIAGSARAFAAGVDIAELNAMGCAERAAWAPRLHAAFDAVARIPQPVVAAVAGHALGGGCELALCADRRIAASNAVFRQPEIQLGLIPGAGGTQRLPRLVAPSVAKDLMFSGRHVDAAEVLRLGLVNEVVEPGDLLARARLDRPVRRRSRLAPRGVKQAVDAGLDSGIDAGLALERAHFAAMFGTADTRAGLASFIEHGPGQATLGGR